MKPRALARGSDIDVLVVIDPKLPLTRERAAADHAPGRGSKCFRVAGS